MKKTYLFYDIETTGLNKCFDQVLQFAAIRTDTELNELKQHDILIKLNPDIIPSPTAIITHNISIATTNTGICEYEAINQIHQLMNQPSTISVGYNTLGFDDEFLRFSFYRNLLTPYTHQHANGCGRMDIYPMAAMFYLFKNEALEWPKLDGKNVLKLEYLNSANQLVAGNAHEAMADVKATLELARRFIRYREMWDYLCGCFDKNTDLARMAKLSDAIMVNGIYGADNYYQIPVLLLGRHNHYKNQTLWLRLDTEELAKTTLESIPETTYVVRKKAGEAGILLPTSPRFMRYMSKERLELIELNKKWLDANPKIFDKIADYHKEYKYPEVPNADLDATLYQNGFLSAYEQSMCQKFHNADIEGKISMLDQFVNPKLREQAVRILGRNYLKHLPEKYAAEFKDHLKHIDPADENDALVDYKYETRLTPKAALDEIQNLKNTKNLTVQQLQLLNELEHYIRNIGM